MRIRRRSQLGRRSRQSSDLPKSSSSFAYRSRRSAEEVNLGRQLSREPRGSETSRGWGRFLLQRFGLVVLLFAMLVSLINVLSLSSDARIMSLSGSTSSFLHDKTVYENAADKLLAGSIWNHNKITVNTASVSRGILKQFPELSSASVTLPLLSKKPVVYIQTAQPALILATNNGAFVVDTTGKVLISANRLPVNSRLSIPTVTDQSGFKAGVNRQALNSGDVSFIQTVVAQLASRHLTVSAMALPVGTSELDVHIVGQPYTVKFNLESGDARQQAGTFLATQHKLQSQNVTPAQYIDVRVDGRAYYK